MKLTEKFKSELKELLRSEGLLPLSKFGHCIVTYDISIENNNVVNLKRIIDNFK